jgi:hypothetical protein
MISIGYGTFWVSSGVTASPGSKSWRSAHRGTLVKSFSTIDQMMSAARSVGRSSAYSNPWNQHVVGLCCMKHEGAECTCVLSTVRQRAAYKGVEKPPSDEACKRYHAHGGVL